MTSHLLLLVQTLVHKGRHDPDLGVLVGELLDALWTGDQVEEEDVLLGDTPTDEHLHRHESRATCPLSIPTPMLIE